MMNINMLSTTFSLRLLDGVITGKHCVIQDESYWQWPDGFSGNVFILVNNGIDSLSKLAFAATTPGVTLL